MIFEDIKTSYKLAKEYVEKCCIKVNQGGKVITGFSEHFGKNRVTDWGGTSSAIYIFSKLGYPENKRNIDDLNLAKQWLLNDQNDDGSWEAAEMQCSEATSAVLFDLISSNALENRAKDSAIKYILDCYLSNVGAFISRPNINQQPHIYTTYLAVRALSICETKRFNEEKKRKIIEWINNSKSSDGNWGPSSQSLSSDVAHTVFALFILFYCGVSKKEIYKKYYANIKWLKKHIKEVSLPSSAFTYEAIEVYDELFNDGLGETARILKSYHFTTALLCSLFLMLGKLDISKRLVSVLIKLRKERGGWGLTSEEKVFVWATQQAIDCLCTFEKELLNKHTKVFANFLCIVYSIPYFKTKLCLAIIIIITFIVLSKCVNMLWDIVIGFAFLIIPWLVKRDD